MKVTAIIPDEMISDIRKYTGGKNITDSLIRALEDWLYTRRLQELNEELSNQPVEFKEGFTAEQIRKLNQRV